jgi:NAD(P)-dependent dehydrogenase (short-subunit alcohol dehydrogenase family)
MNAVIIGGSGGIGEAFVRYLEANRPGVRIIASYNQGPPPADTPHTEWRRLDVTRQDEIERFCADLPEVDLCINAAGMLHNERFSPEKSTRQIDSGYFLDSMAVNAMPTLLLARYIEPHLKHKRPAVFATVSARVGSIEENYLGGWYSYRASKAALNMILKTLSIEWKRKLPQVCVAALHPGTTDTRLSRPFSKNVKPDHLFTTKQSVDYMMRVVEQLTPEQSGQFWSFDGEPLPW